MWKEPVTRILTYSVPPVAAALIGIYVGGRQLEKREQRRRQQRIARLKRMIEEELRALLAQLPTMRDNVQGLKRLLEAGNIFSGRFVRPMNTGYKQHITELYQHLNIKERACLHCLYEQFRIADEFLSAYEDRIKHEIRMRGATVSQEYIDRLSDVLTRYNIAECLVRSYLGGEPKDVTHIEAMMKEYATTSEKESGSHEQTS